jgi:hypothetical protein
MVDETEQIPLEGPDPLVARDRRRHGEDRCPDHHAHDVARVPPDREPIRG